MTRMFYAKCADNIAILHSCMGPINMSSFGSQLRILGVIQRAGTAQIGGAVQTCKLCLYSSQFTITEAKVWAPFLIKASFLPFKLSLPEYGDDCFQVVFTGQKV